MKIKDSGNRREFTTGAVRDMARPIAVGTLARIVLAPAIGILSVFLCATRLGWFEATPGAYAALLSLFGSPVAVSSAIMAKGMGGDEQLATQLVVWTTLSSGLTVFLLVCGLMAMGLIPV